MARLLSVCLLFYLLTFIGLRLFIHASGKNNDTEPVRNAADLVARSDRHDFKRLRLSGAVVQSGHYFYDLLFIPSYSFQTNSGLTMRVFASKAVPATGQHLGVVGVFRQYYQGSYGSWLGLVEKERTYSEASPLAGPSGNAVWAP